MRLSLPAILVSALLVTACASGTTTGQSSSSAQSSAPADKFTVAPQSTKVSGEDVFVFTYENVRLARLDAAKLSKDGKTIGGTAVPWKGTPRFYRKENVMALYAGANPKVITILDAQYGPAFAGPVVSVSSAAN